jgi:hypothetical protein
MATLLKLGISSDLSTSSLEQISTCASACQRRKKSNLSQSQFDIERQKAASDQDIFLVFVTGDSPVDMEASERKDGLVDRSSLRAYFGPFAGRGHSQSWTPRTSTLLLALCLRAFAVLANVEQRPFFKPAVTSALKILMTRNAAQTFPRAFCRASPFSRTSDQDECTRHVRGTTGSLVV